MSGGHFGMTPGSVAMEYGGEWADAELNELFFDLFGGGWGGYHGPLGMSGREREPEFGRTWSEGCNGGLAETLDLFVSGDISEEQYREQVVRFKDKWLRRTDEDRRDFYAREFEEAATELVRRLRDELVGD